MAEEGHVLAVAVGVDHEVDGERLGPEVARGYRAGHLAAVEAQSAQ